MKKHFKLLMSLGLAACSMAAVGAGLASKAAPVEETKAATKTTVYYAIPDSVVGTYTVKLNVKLQGDVDNWKQYDMTKESKTMTDGTPVYSYTFTDLYDGLAKLQFQLYDGSTWKSQEEPISGWTSQSVYNGKCKVYGKSGWITPFYSTGRYIVGKFGDGNWDIEHAVYMNHSGEYTGTVKLGFKDEFKIANWNGFTFDSYFGYSKVTPNAAAYYCFTQGTNSGEYDNKNIQCYAAGSYTFYFTDNAYDGSYKISVAINGGKTAQQLAAKLMSWGATPEEGKCGDKFPECKTMYLGLSGDEQTAFQAFASESEEQFLNAYNRYVAWANALGEKPWEDGKVSSSSLVLNTLMSEESSNIMIIVVVSVVALSAVAGFVFYKKRKNA